MAFDHLRDPRHNLREVVKQWLLLEEHLSDPAKRCPECIAKHCLWAEALVDEARQLDVRNQYRAQLDQLSTDCKSITHAIKHRGADASAVVRQARKALQPLVF